MAELMKEVVDMLPTNAFVVSSQKGNLIFIECYRGSRTLLDIVESMEEKGFEMVHGLQHTIIPHKCVHEDLYSVTLRKKSKPKF